MSVHVIDTTNPTAWIIQDDENGHVGTVDSSTLSYGQNMDGTSNHDVVVIPCPVCDTTSWWPRESLPSTVSQAMT